MDSFQNSVSFWATILGTLLGVFGALQSLTWLAAIGILITCGSVSSLMYARKQRLHLKSATLTISGRSIDSLNLASLRRRTNRSLVIQEVENKAVIDGEDLTITWHSTGYCRGGRETAMECSIDADTNIPFDRLECFAYDLRRDPERRHRIQPILVGPDGTSKKVAIPFLAPLSAREPFNMVVHWNLPGCMRAGVDYYTATLSFDQDRIERYSMRLIFRGDLPKWVRAYEYREDGQLKLLKALQPQRKGNPSEEYLDADTSIPARSARVYLFQREAMNAHGRTRIDKAA
jgi:hypothetical protein